MVLVPHTYKFDNMKVSYNKVIIITVGKVGTSNFLHAEYNLKKDNIIHTHNLNILRECLKNDTNCLIIVGIRNPIDRNLSNLFQTYSDNFYNDVKTIKNNYKGEYCYIPEMTLNSTPEEVISLYFNQKYHNTFNEWFKEFFEITKLDKKIFNKNNGIEFYKFPNNNTIMLYTLEKLDQNINYINQLLQIKNINNNNNSENRNYKNLYLNVKNKIKYNKKYLDNLLNTEIMKFFYTQGDINNMYLKYNIII